MTNAQGIVRLTSGLDPTFLLPRPTIPRHSIQKSSPELPVGDEVPPESDSESCIQCINCLDMISAEVIDSHRAVCSSFTEINISSEGALTSSKSQAFKFSQYLETFLKNNQRLSPSESLMMRSLLRASRTVSETTTEYLVISQFHDSVKAIWDSCKGNSTLQIVAKRLLAIIKTQINILQSTVVQQRKSKMNDLKNKLNKLRKNKPHSQSNSDLRIDRDKIDEINSQIKSRKASSGRFTESEVAAERKNSKVFNDEVCGDFQQYFYGICLQTKMQMNEFSPAQAVSIPFLYEKATREKIAPESWPQFIHEQLSDSNNWKATTAKKPPLMRKSKPLIHKK